MMDIIARQLAKASNNTVTQLENINIDTIEPTGFYFPESVLSYQNNTKYVDLNFDENTRVFTIAPKSPYTSYSIYIKGTKITKTSLESVTISNNNGGHFIYFDDNGVLKESLSNLFFTDAHIPVAYVYWHVEDQKSPVFALETHGCILDHATHLYLHETIGAKYVNGLIAGNYNLLGDGSSNSDVQLSISNGQVDDEDIRFFITHSATPVDFGEQILSPIAYLPVNYRKGSQGHWTYDVENEFPVKQGTLRPQINKIVDGSWTTIDVSGDDKFIIMWLVSCNCKTPIKSIVSQGEYDTLEEAQAVSFADLDIGDIPAIESKALWKLIYQTNSTYANTPKCKLVGISSLLNIQGVRISSTTTVEHNTLTGRNAVESHPASAITFTNSITELDSSNVQDAIDEFYELTQNSLNFKEPLLIKGDVIAGSNKISISGSANNSVIGTGLSVDVNENNIIHNNIGSLQGGLSSERYHLSVNQYDNIILSNTAITTKTNIITNDTSLDNNYHIVLTNASSNNISVSLPTSIGILGREYIIKKTDSSNNTVTILPYGVELIDGYQGIIINNQNDSYTLVSNNTGWNII